MTNIAELLDVDALTTAVADGWVRAAKHPTLPVTAYKYTEKSVYEGHWDDITRLTRGLLVHDNGTVLARPFAKFFNMFEPLADDIKPTEAVTVTDKVDGSMGASWMLDGQWYINTPGSADSEQAREGTKMLRAVADFAPLDGVTYIFEVVYPGSKVVVHYDFEGLVLLAGVRIATGEVIEAADLPGWSGRRVEVLPATTLAEVLSMSDRPNREGVVVRTADGRALKVKQEDYVRLHRLVTGMTDRRVAELTLAGELDAMMSHLPEEFHEAMTTVATEAVERYEREVARLTAVFDSVPAFETQKERAMWVQGNVDMQDRWVAFRPTMPDVSEKVSKQVVEGFKAE